MTLRKLPWGWIVGRRIMCSRDGYGKFHLFGCDHITRSRLGGKEIDELLENCGGCRP